MNCISFLLGSWWNWFNEDVQNITAWNMPKIMLIDAGILKCGHSNAVASLDFASENQVVDFIARWRHLSYKFFNTELTDVFRTKQCWSVPKMTQIGSGVLNIWVVKHSGLTFLANPVGAKCGVSIKSIWMLTIFTRTRLQCAMMYRLLLQRCRHSRVICAADQWCQQVASDVAAARGAQRAHGERL